MNVHERQLKNNKNLVVYISMAFGNPYNEPYHADIVAELTEKLYNMHIGIIAVSDTTGISKRENFSQLFSSLLFILFIFSSILEKSFNFEGLSETTSVIDKLYFFAKSKSL